MQNNLNAGQNDRRLREVQHELEEVGHSILQMQMYVETLPEQERPKARRTLSVAFRAGSIFHRLEQLPLPPPVDLYGNLALGPMLREHILRSRDIYRKIDQLRQVVNLFDDKTEELLRSIIAKKPPEISDTSATGFDVVV